ncbi:hypothetical protein DFH27DRAFT_567681 [Peziza echinospora]|nr:hypothetical protein DFH27DRAFT_587607 [Peziza echinospora]KAI5793896.1 hypothetical protein DFH27DRAFT_567681 [Peziza echinospora]
MPPKALPPHMEPYRPPPSMGPPQAARSTMGPPPPPKPSSTNSQSSISARFDEICFTSPLPRSMTQTVAPKPSVLLQHKPPQSSLSQVSNAQPRQTGTVLQRPGPGKPLAQQPQVSGKTDGTAAAQAPRASGGLPQIGASVRSHTYGPSAWAGNSHSNHNNNNNNIQLTDGRGTIQQNPVVPGSKLLQTTRQQQQPISLQHNIAGNLDSKVPQATAHPPPPQHPTKPLNTQTQERVDAPTPSSTQPLKKRPHEGSSSIASSIANPPRKVAKTAEPVRSSRSVRTSTVQPEKPAPAFGWSGTKSRTRRSLDRRDTAGMDVGKGDVSAGVPVEKHGGKDNGKEVDKETMEVWNQKKQSKVAVNGGTEKETNNELVGTHVPEEEVLEEEEEELVEEEEKAEEEVVQPKPQPSKRKPAVVPSPPPPPPPQPQARRTRTSTSSAILPVTPAPKTSAAADKARNIPSWVKTIKGGNKKDEIAETPPTTPPSPLVTTTTKSTLKSTKPAAVAAPAAPVKKTPARKTPVGSGKVSSSDTVEDSDDGDDDDNGGSRRRKSRRTTITPREWWVAGAISLIGSTPSSSSKKMGGGGSSSTETEAKATSKSKSKGTKRRASLPAQSTATKARGRRNVRRKTEHGVGRRRDDDDDDEEEEETEEEEVEADEEGEEEEPEPQPEQQPQRKPSTRKRGRPPIQKKNIVDTEAAVEEEETQLEEEEEGQHPPTTPTTPTTPPRSLRSRRSLPTPIVSIPPKKTETQSPLPPPPPEQEEEEEEEEDKRSQIPYDPIRSKILESFYRDEAEVATDEDERRKYVRMADEIEARGKRMELKKEKELQEEKEKEKKKEKGNVVPALAVGRRGSVRVQKKVEKEIQKEKEKGKTPLEREQAEYEFSDVE